MAKGEAVQLLPESNRTCLLIKGAFDKAFCKEIIQTYNDGFLPANSHYPTHYRNNERQVKDDPIFGSQLFEHIQCFIPQTLEVNGNNSQENGKWEVLGLNERLRICRYKSGQYFNRHLDGIHYRTSTVQSKLTFMIYLNGEEDFEGGRTLFFNDNVRDNLLASIGEDGYVKIWQYNPLNLVSTFKLNWPLTTMSYDVEKSILYVGGTEGKIVGLRYTEREGLRPFLEHSGHQGKVCTIKINQKYIVTGGEDNKVVIWEKIELKKLYEYKHSNFVQDLILMKDKIISVSYDGKIMIHYI